MPEEKDLNKVPVVTEPDLKADVVNQPDLNNADSVDQQNQDDVLADGTTRDKTVKYSEFEKANQAKKKAEEDAAYAQRQLEILQANMQQTAQPPVKQVASTYEQAMLDLGLTADDLYIGENMVKVQRRKSELDSALQQYQTAIEANKQFVANCSDFPQVVGSVNPLTGVMMAWSQEALSLQQKKPYLAGAFQNAQGAYQAIMDERKLMEFEKKAAVNQEHINRQDADIQSEPMGGSAAGSGGAGDMQPALMSRQQVLDIEQKLESGQKV